MRLSFKIGEQMYKMITNVSIVLSEMNVCFQFLIMKMLQVSVELFRNEFFVTVEVVWKAGIHIL